MVFIGKMIASIAAAYLVICLAMYLAQRKLQYFPTKVEVMDPLKYDLAAEVVETKTSDGLTLSHWYAPPKDGKPLFVYFHGNAGYLGDREARGRILLVKGYGIYFAEYRGYGSNKGQPTEAGFIADAKSVIDDAIARGHNDIIIYGESIGTGVAVQIAAMYQDVVKGVILEAPFTSAADVAKQKYPYLPVDALMKDPFRSVDHMANVTAPLLVIHGAKDRLIPISLGRALFDAANEPKEFVTFENEDHIIYFDALYKDGLIALDVILAFTKKYVEGEKLSAPKPQAIEAQ